MSTLTSASTDAQVNAAYDDNASYAEDNSAIKAAAFITACRFLIRRSATEVATGAERIRLDQNIAQYRQEIKEAQQWQSTVAAASGGVTHFGFGDFRN